MGRRRHGNEFLLVLFPVLAALIASPLLADPGDAYSESSNGLVDNPLLDGGFTEVEMVDVDGDGNIDLISVGDHGSPRVTVTANASSASAISTQPLILSLRGNNLSSTGPSRAIPV